MIGVISYKQEERVVRECFELFKTPWECHSPDRNYDVVLSTRSDIPKTNSTLVVMPFAIVTCFAFPRGNDIIIEGNGASMGGL